MGVLVDGVWKQNDVRDGEKNSKGEFLRKPVTFRNKIELGGRFAPEADRYHLYVSYACPWAHRTLIMRAVKGLDKIISVDVVSPNMMNDGWSFLNDYDQVPKDSLFGSEYLRDIYLKADAKFSGRVTVPILWDKKENTIVNNESSEIIRFFNSDFAEFSHNHHDFYPKEKRQEIDQWNELIYHNVNNGVYRCGFAKSQEAYEEAYQGLFKTLNQIETQLTKTKFLTGDEISEADIRLFPTLIRFDSVYHTHFKCNGRLIAQYPGLSRFIKEILALPGVKETVNMPHIKQHYFYSHDTINPSRIVPLGPNV